MPKQYSWLQRYRIHRRAKQKLGHSTRDPQDRFEFMQQCMDEMIQSGEAEGADDARDVCELMWDEEESLGEY